MLFLIAQIKRFETLNTMQKTAALYTAPFLKKIKKNCQKRALLRNVQKKTLLIPHDILHISEEGGGPDFVQNLHGSGGGGGRGALTRTEPNVASFFAPDNET